MYAIATAAYRKKYGELNDELTIWHNIINNPEMILELFEEVTWP